MRTQARQKGDQATRGRKSDIMATSPVRRSSFAMALGNDVIVNRHDTTTRLIEGYKSQAIARDCLGELLENVGSG